MPTDTGPDDRPVVLLDTSAAVALVLADHEWHDLARAATRGRRLGLAGHAWFETFSVLTRLPAGVRRSPADAARILAHNFPSSEFLDETRTRELTSELSGLGIAGGAVYDVLVGAAARVHGRPLLSGDARARPTYEALGVLVEPLE